MHANSSIEHSKQFDNLTKASLRFIIYVRTLQFVRTRLKNVDESQGVFIPQEVIIKEYFPQPRFDFRSELNTLVRYEELEITEHLNPATGHHRKHYRALKAGAVDLYMLAPEPAKYGSNLLKMRDTLMKVSLPDDVYATEYFRAFLMHKHDLLDLFFRVDDFSGRVHTPITSLSKCFRDELLIDGCPTVGIDVKTMQPLLLGNILKKHIGINQFSNWIDTGVDVYVRLQELASLSTRDEAKKKFFEVLFAPANDELAATFGNSRWIEWINYYKRYEEPGNPHGKFKQYSNLAWLLQTEEVALMKRVWLQLIKHNIDFLSVHDEIIIKQRNAGLAYCIIKAELDKVFSYYRLNVSNKAVPENDIRENIRQLYTKHEKVGLGKEFVRSLTRLKEQPEENFNQNYEMLSEEIFFNFGIYVTGKELQQLIINWHNEEYQSQEIYTQEKVPLNPS